MPSFTIAVPSLRTQGPVAEVQIAISGAMEEALRKRDQPIPKPIKGTAIIDTGATGTVIQRGLAGQLGLNPIGVEYIRTASSSNVECHAYAVRVVFPRVVIDDVKVVELPLPGNIQCLIGRNILAHGVFIYLGYMNQFTLSF